MVPASTPRARLTCRSPLISSINGRNKRALAVTQLRIVCTHAINTVCSILDSNSYSPSIQKRKRNVTCRIANKEIRFIFSAALQSGEPTRISLRFNIVGSVQISIPIHIHTSYIYTDMSVLVRSLLSARIDNLIQL